ncbi:MAG TPA: T9SS type A sorting domain-containing protein [Saprospiraceae bacterium]|nr:T9SS type A sorting domain-containing protein [Saprospiraceae bacterium]
MWPQSNCNAQFQLESAQGDNYFWDFLTRQVDSITFEVRTFRNDELEWSGTEYLNTSCSYDGGEVNVADGVGANDQVNVLFVTPKSPETYSDYTNGVSTLDIVIIIRYLNDSVSFNNWALTAADVNYSMSVDTHDVNAIRDLILAKKSNFGSNGRKSWGWVPHVDLLAFITSSNPFQYPVGGPGYAEWWSPSPRSRNQITNSSFNDLRFWSIKFGDVYSSGSASHNSWVCGSGGYGNSLRDEPQISTRSTLDPRFIVDCTNVMAGDEIELEIVVDRLEKPLAGYQIALDLDPKQFDLINIQYEEGIRPYYNYNPYIKKHMFLEYSRTLESLPVQEGKIMTLNYRARKDIDNVCDMIKWPMDKINEMIGNDGELTEASLSMRMSNIIRKEFTVEYSQNYGQTVFRVNTPSNGKSTIHIVDLGGRVLYQRNMELTEGYNEIPVDIPLKTGIYIMNLQHGSGQKSIKFFVN